jgi:hypothetical protein
MRQEHGGVPRGLMLPPEGNSDRAGRRPSRYGVPYKQLAEIRHTHERPSRKPKPWRHTQGPEQVLRGRRSGRRVYRLEVRQSPTLPSRRGGERRPALPRRGIDLQRLYARRVSGNGSAADQGWWKRHRDAVLVSVISAVLASGALAIFDSNGLARGLFDAVTAPLRELFDDDQTKTEMQVNHFLQGVSNSPIWESKPFQHRPARAFLISNWSEFSPYVARRYRTSGPRVGLDELFEDTELLSAGPVEIMAYVARQFSYSGGHADSIYQSVTLASGNQSASARCNLTRKRNNRLKTGDLMVVVGVPVASGTYTNGRDVTYLACASAKRQDVP